MKNIDKAYQILNKIISFVGFIQNVADFLRESPEDELQRLLRMREELWESHQVLINKRNSQDKQNASYFLFFRIDHVSDDEKKLRRTEDRLFAKEEDKLSERISELEKQLRLGRSFC